MDLEPALKHAALRVRDGLVRYAKSKDWPLDDYYIFIVVNTKWGLITVEFVSRAFESEKIEQFEYYDEILDFLEDDLKDRPELYDSVGLILRSLDGYTFQEDRYYGENMVEVDDDLLNPGKTQPLRGPVPYSP